ncbi:hypothetical protein [Pareuzebyella sediminis]|nr:hypothetical protein [Pareuzebyella sediminis]
MKTTLIFVVGLFIVLAVVVVTIGFLRMFFEDLKKYVSKKIVSAFENN